MSRNPELNEGGEGDIDQGPGLKIASFQDIADELKERYQSVVVIAVPKIEVVSASGLLHLAVLGSPYEVVGMLEAVHGAVSGRIQNDLREEDETQE